MIDYVSKTTYFIPRREIMTDMTREERMIAFEKMRQAFEEIEGIDPEGCYSETE